MILQNILLDDSIELGADERQIALNAVKVSVNHTSWILDPCMCILIFKQIISSQQRTAVQTTDQATTKQAIHLKDLLINLRKLRQLRSRSLSDKHSSITNNKDVSQPNILFGITLHLILPTNKLILIQSNHHPRTS